MSILYIIIIQRTGSSIVQPQDVDFETLLAQTVKASMETHKQEEKMSPQKKQPVVESEEPKVNLFA